jgi:hypothetical protein
MVTGETGSHLTPESLKTDAAPAREKHLRSEEQNTCGKRTTEHRGIRQENTP